MLDPRVEGLAEKVERLEKLMEKLIESFNEHWHDVGQFEGFGLASYKVRYEFQIKESGKG